MAFLPMNIKEVKARGWDEVDFVYVMGDSYVDHPSFGAAIITRVLEDCGYRVAVLSQPDWKNDADFLQFGKPRLGFFVTAGNIDSMACVPQIDTMHPWLSEGAFLTITHTQKTIGCICFGFMVFYGKAQR